MRKIHLSFQKNIRDLGGLTGHNGLKVKNGRIYRGGFLGKVSDEDVQIINELHLTDMIDFRSSGDFKNSPDYPFVGVTFHNFPLMKEDLKIENKKGEDSNLLWFIDKGLDGFSHMYNLYPRLLLEENAIISLRKFFKLLVSKPDGIFYFHCSQGKDRAGLAAYLLEIALGISKETAKEDYLRSNEAMKIRTKYHIEQLCGKDFYNEEYEKALYDVFSAKEEYLNHAIESVEAKYGSIEEYIVNELRVDIPKLRELYLE